MSNHLGTDPFMPVISGQDHQGDEVGSFTIPDWKENIAFCRLNIFVKESPASTSGM